MRLALCVALLLGSNVASASVDWARGLIIARSVAAADLRAPSPDIARVAAERAAREALAKQLREGLRALPVAGGGTVGGRAEKDPAAKAALDEIVKGTTPERTLHSDGSVTVQVTVPLSRISESVLGAKPEGTEERATLLVIDARKLKAAKPALGWRVRAGDVTRTAPTYFRADPDPAETPALEARATGVRDGVLLLDLPKAQLADAKGLWVVVVTGGEK